MSDAAVSAGRSPAMAPRRARDRVWRELHKASFAVAMHGEVR